MGTGRFTNGNLCERTWWRRSRKSAGNVAALAALFAVVCGGWSTSSVAWYSCREWSHFHNNNYGSFSSLLLLLLLPIMTRTSLAELYPEDDEEE